MKACECYTKVKQIARNLFKTNKKCGYFSPYFSFKKYIEQ
ncbi:hypothetical protein HMPREF9095_0571 [Haemophilus aegyptius ATCC 11116]|nr:hypothetical protein HMPREF9095_0571 [Haemophilus aegyptius ATCC 11116]